VQSAFGRHGPRHYLAQLKRVSLGRDNKETKMGTTNSRAFSGIVGAFLLAFLVLPAQAYYIEITEPVEGATYAPCGPDTIFWDSDIPASPGSPDNLRLSWRSQGGEWEVFANDNNDGAHPWPTPPCFLGWYDVRILYTEDPSVGDTVRFFVDGTPPPPPPPYYIDITLPAEVDYYCAPSEVRWESDVDPGEGDVLEVSYGWETGWGFQGWYTIGVSSNDGVLEWDDPPCWNEFGMELDRTWRVRMRYLPDPSVYDEVEFRCVRFPIEGPYGIFIDFAGDAHGYSDVVRRIDPPLYTSVEAYVALLGTEGFHTVSFAVKDVPPTGALTPLSFESLLPGGLAIGSLDAGLTLSSTECMQPGEIVYLAKLTTFYFGGTADIEIRDHPDYPKWVVNCEDEVGYYEVANHGGVGKDPVSTTVEAMSWGAIKAMYRD